MLTSEIATRHAEQDDVPLILSFIQKKAEFDQSMGAFMGRLQTTEAKLSATLFNDTPFAKVLFAEVSQQVVGFALYYFRYSSFAAQPSLWLDDLYVDTPRRCKGIGTILMAHLAYISQGNHCTHISWTVSANNVRGIEFYKKLGAEVVEKKCERFLFQANTDVISKLAQLANTT